MTSNTLADQIGQLDAQIKALTEQLDALKDKAKSSGLEEIEGLIFKVSIGKSIRSSLIPPASRRNWASSGTMITASSRRSRPSASSRAQRRWHRSKAGGLRSPFIFQRLNQQGYLA